MKRFIVLFLVGAVSLVDVLLTTVWYCNGYKFRQTFSQAFIGYSFTGSLFELWVLSILRFSLISGLILGILKGKQNGVNRVKSSRTASECVAALLLMFTMIKLLSVSENGQLVTNSWFWVLFTWTLVSSVVIVIQWRILGNIKFPVPAVMYINDYGQAEYLSESENLLDNGRDGDAREKHSDKTTSSARNTILRLLALSKPDWMFVGAGFIFLVLSAIGEIFIPFYMGKVYGMVIDTSQKGFIRAIIIMTLISVASAVTAGLRGGCMLVANRRLNLRIRNSLFASILKQEVEFFDSVQTGS